MSYEDSLHSALHLTKTRSGPQLPWDKGIFAQIFDEDHASSFGINKRLRLTAPQSLLAAPSASHSHPPEVDQPDGARPLAPLPNFRSLLLPTSSLALEKIEGRRHTAITRFFFLLGSSPACGLNSSSSDIWTLHQSFVDCLAPKATGTLVKRSLDLQKYNGWCKSNNVQFIPFLADHVYSYLRHLAKNSSASAPLSAVQAISFAIHVLDCDCHGARFPSSRIKGLCHGRLSQAPAPSHAKPLTVDQIMKLETMCAAADDHYDCLVVGTLLICLYARARWGDLQQANSLIIDPPDNPRFFELPTRNFKTSNTLAKGRRFLPITAILFNLSEFKWWKRYVEARIALNLGSSGPLSHPLLPVMDKDTPTSEAVGSKFVTSFLRTHLNDPDLRSHSLKHTLLSFAAKAGLDPPCRKLLGYHLDRSEVTMATYSRDMLSQPLKRLHDVLKQVRCGKFFPDSSRSGYVLDSEEETEVVPSSPSAANSDSDDDASSPSSSVDSSPPSTVADRLEVPEHGSPCYDVPPDCAAVQHQTSKRLHIALPVDAPRVLCGRGITPAFHVLSAWPSYPLPTCVTCFSTKKWRQV